MKGFNYRIADRARGFYFNPSYVLVGSIQEWGKFTFRKKNQNFNSHFDNGVCGGAISILKWDKILIIGMGFTNGSGQGLLMHQFFFLIQSKSKGSNSPHPASRIPPAL